MHTQLKIDDALQCVIKILFYSFMEPVDLFKILLLLLYLLSNDLMVDNIVSPEDGETMKDYWLHMVMFKYCNSVFPEVKYTLHAGELTLGLVQPEDLTLHTTLYVAGANRIGHGVDMAYEKKCLFLLNTWLKKYTHRN
jgi:adenosine deaminase/adenosine deaminase CECR1